MQGDESIDRTYPLFGVNLMLCFNLHLNTSYQEDIKVLQSLLKDNNVSSIDIINDGLVLTVRFVMKEQKNKKKTVSMYQTECESLKEENKRLRNKLTRIENHLETLKKERNLFFNKNHNIIKVE